MAVFRALQTAAGATRRNLVLFAVAAAYGLVQIPQLAAQAFQPMLAGVVSLAMSALLVFVLPFYFAGIIGMANEAIDGRTSLDTLIDAGKRYYVSVFVVYLLIFGVSFVLGVVAFLVAIVGVGAGLGAAQSGGGTGGAVLVAGLVVAVIGLLYLVVVFFTQFFGHAIVVDDLGAVDGLKRSVGAVRDNLLATLGYTILVAVVGGLFGVFGALFGLLTSAGLGGQTAPAAPSAATTPTAALPSVGLAGVAALLVVYVVGAGVFGGFFAAYSTAFYREIRPDASLV
ncbi:MAG: hypothetical protein ABEJ82_09455 [Haloplanus sp.]